ncbi:MAG TPA: histidine kinase [Trebonia sp.]|jgi:signal transduction histidine kinase|nr:histidine kinase [Trebonia sp.]
MATFAAAGDAPDQRDAPAQQYSRAPWSPRAWRAALYLTGGVPALLAAPVLVAAGLGAKHNWGLGIVLLAAFLFAVPVLTRVHRHRLRVTSGVEVPPQPAVSYLSVAGIVAAARSQATWRQVGYHLLAAPALAAGAIAAFGMWLTGAAFTFVYAFAWGAPPHSIFARGKSAPPSWHPLWMLGLPADVWLTAAGIAALVIAPRFTAFVAATDARAARVLLGPSRAVQLEHRVEHLTQTRAGVVDAADAERRRLERDLHDGTQQRLVSLAMRLGMARANGALTDSQAQHVIAEAHEEAKAALAELRNLVRGLHPAVLEDRGLDAALSGVTARMPIPVRLTVDVPRRPSPAIEAIAYFVVSEGLTNITKHAQATQAEVYVQRADDRLHIIVTDDGVGGASPSRGTGLAGLAKRAESVDGSFDITSPPGGPTLLSVDLPCAR